MKKDLKKRLQHKLGKLPLDQYNVLCHWGYVLEEPGSFKLHEASVLSESGQALIEAGEQIHSRLESIEMQQINRE